MKQKHVCVSINAISVSLFFLAAVTMLFLGLEVHRINSGVQEEAQIQKNYQKCEELGVELAAGSDLLTDEVWRFIATEEREHLDHYWEEVKVTQSREKSLEALKALSPSPEELACFEEAKRCSDQLMEGETWAMRLTAEALGVKPDTLPAEVAAMQLTSGELALSPDQQRQLAVEYLFGVEYKDAKKKITDQIDAFQESLSVHKGEELSAAMGRTRAALYSARVLSEIMLLLMFLIVAAVYWLVTRPFRGYARKLRSMEKTGFTTLEEKGSRDVVRFAQTFNNIYYDWKSQNDQMKEEQFRFHVAMDHTPMVIFEYLVASDEYTAYGLLDGRRADGPEAGDTPVARVIPDFLKSRAAEIVGERGAVTLQRLVEYEGGTQELPILFNGVMIWGRITATPIYDREKHFVKLIGKIANIDPEREKEHALEEMLSRDSLTGVYNRESGVRRVQEYMVQKSGAESCGLMLLDMDNFAQINETEGVTFADAILIEVADTLRKMLGPEDLVIRLGGDEFMLFVKGCTKERAYVLGPQIVAAIRALSPKANPRLVISASIGMCVTEVVDEYSGLYRCSESALQYVKEHGKERAVRYMDASDEMGAMLTQLYPGTHSITQIERTQGSREDLVTFALDLLGKSKNLNDALFLLLARVGKLYVLDRVSIIDVDAEYLTCRITQQWTKHPSDSQNSEVYYISAEELDKVTVSYDEDGLSSSYEVINLHGIGSILHAAIWNHGAYAGIMAFERREKDYMWTGEERQILSELIKIISSFTLKARADAVSEAKTEFLSRMSHEIRTPMNAITGMTTIAKASLGDTEKTMGCLNKIESANAYLLNLINDILDMSRIENGKMEISPVPVNPEEQLGSLDAMMRPQAEAKDLRFTVENLTERGEWIMADHLRINQVLINLLGNAVKFTGPGGSVTLRVETVEETAQAAVLRFRVTDTGIGISEEAQKRIFNAFEQASSNTASAYGGTGLGLAISSRLVQMMGGTLEVRSTPGEGSDFFFTLHVARAKARGFEDSPQTDSREAGAYSSDGKRILLVEDNELNREIAGEILAMNGYAVEEAEDGSEAVGLFSDKPQGYYDAVLMDVRMPVMDGFEATRQIRTMGKADSRTIPIIAMTANAFDEDMKQSLASGMNGHLSKPIEVDKMLYMLCRYISSGNVSAQKEPEQS